jgi:PBSX family phage terminase large subunit
MIPLSTKQIKSIYESKSKINIWEGAVRSGKTYSSLIRFLQELSTGPQGDYAIVCRTYDSFKRNVLEQLSFMIGADARHYSGKRELKIWGKTIHIIGADDERAEAKLRGPTFSGAYVDEVSIIPESVFKMLISRCAMRGAKIFGTTNPDSPFHWLYRDYLRDNEDVASWQFKLEDNPQLTEFDREYLKRQYKGLWHKRFIEGLWVQAEGAIYDFFEDQYHVIPFAPGLPEYYILGVDYGTTNPCAFVLIGISRNLFPRIWVEKEYYYNSKIHNRQKTDSEYADNLISFIQGVPVRYIYMDPSAVSFRVELQKRGVSNIVPAKNEVIDGIRFISKLMTDGTLKICRACQNLIREFQSYVWDAKSIKTGVDKPMKENDHASDALRYGIFTHLFGRSGGPEGPMTPETLDRLFMEAMDQGQSIPKPFQQPDNIGGSNNFFGGAFF